MPTAAPELKAPDPAPGDVSPDVAREAAEKWRRAAMAQILAAQANLAVLAQHVDRETGPTPAMRETWARFWTCTYHASKALTTFDAVSSCEGAG